MRNNDFVKTATKWLLFLNAFIIEAVFRQRDFADKSLDYQVAIKLALWGVTLLFCLRLYRNWANKLLRIDNAFQLLLLFDIFVSCFYAPNPAYSFGCLLSLITVLFLLLSASAVLTNREMLEPIIYGCSLVAAISIIVYFVNPEFGRMKDWEGAITSLLDTPDGVC